MNYLKQVLTVVKESSPILYSIGLFTFVLAIGCAFGMVLDDRTLLGLNVWTKPFKFSISTGIFILSVGYLITLYPYSIRKKNIINNITSFSLIIELAIIIYQGARGVQSHYNMSSPVDGILFATMGILVGINVLTMVIFMVDTLRLKLRTEKSIQWAILMGWIIILIGSWVGGQMISQMSHNVGVADGGAGLPLVNWSTIAGDLRVAHFFGLHGIQIIPIFAWVLHKKWKTKDLNYILAVTLFGVLYASWIGFTFYQAKQGMALLSI